MMQHRRRSTNSHAPSATLLPLTEDDVARNNSTAIPGSPRPKLYRSSWLPFSLHTLSSSSRRILLLLCAGTVVVLVLLVTNGFSSSSSVNGRHFSLQQSHHLHRFMQRIRKKSTAALQQQQQQHADSPEILNQAAAENAALVDAESGADDYERQAEGAFVSADADDNDQPDDGAAAAVPDEVPLDLEDYDSLAEALEQAELVALYFGASWCPQCAAVTAKLDEHVSLLTLPNDDAPAIGRHPLSLIYISSDRTESEQRDYVQSHERQQHWVVVPWESPERNWLKQLFKICSKLELEQLDLPERLHEVPTILVLDATRSPPPVLTFSGAQDVLTKGLPAAMTKWMELKQISQSMEEREVQEEESLDADDQET